MDFNISIPTDTCHLEAAPVIAPVIRREILRPIEGNHYLLVLDNSAMEKFTTCPVAAYNYLCLRRQASAKNSALVFGGAIHQALEVLLLGPSASESPEDFSLRQDAAIVKHFLENPTPVTDHRTAPLAMQVMKHYRVRQTFPDYEWEIKNKLVEVPFELPLGVLNVNANIQLPSWSEPRFVETVSVAWSGKIDAIAECNSRVRVVDHKTTSIAGDNFVQDFKLSNQTIGYVWAAQQLFPDLNVTGFCGNAIHLKKPGASGYGSDLLLKGPRGGDPSLNFFRFYFEYSPERLVQWERNAISLCSDFVHCLVRNYFPSHTKWCFGKYGRCPYHDACVIDEESVREHFLLSAVFEPVTWDPTL